jgi:L-seryl-tRNA(Ser) seleniumtransferase
VPQVGRLVDSKAFQPLVDAYSRPEVTREVRRELQRLREEASSSQFDAGAVEPDVIRQRVQHALELRAYPYYRRVINATGVVLHTALGRAPLASEAVEALARDAERPLRLEIDLETGDRGGRDEGCAALLRELTGCESAIIVNNNASGTLLILAALARGKRVLVSRGEMVEIGDSFRIPEIMKEGGAILVDVGTTNRTYLRDYESAIDQQTGLILKVHTSNYRIQGFTSEVPIEELVALGRLHAIPVVHDLGSGSMIDLARYAAAGEPLVAHSVAAGADVVCFSGDKLLGGPQAGIILGREDAVRRCRRHALYRALRPGRLTYVALEATLRIYLDGPAAALERIPALRRLVAPPGELRSRARELASRFSGIAGIRSDVVSCESQAGSGALPARDLESWAVRVVPAGAATAHVERLARMLRTGSPSILARVKDDALLLDVRTIDDEEFDEITRRLREICGE